MSSSWFLGDCAVLQVDDRCKIFRLSLSSARTASLFRCVPYVRAFSLPRSACICVCRICVQRVGARSRVRAGANEIGEIRSARRSADGGCPSVPLELAGASRRRRLSLSTAPRRTAPRRKPRYYDVGSRLREKRSADERITRKLVGDRPGRSFVHRA